MQSSQVLVKDLNDEPFRGVLCYPLCPDNEVTRRLRELRRLGVTDLRFDGRTRIGSLGVLGKGCVSVAVKARADDRICALKIRRTDANRSSMEQEARYQRRANDLEVGPKFYRVSKNFLLMELVEGQRIGDWIRQLKGRGSTALLRKNLKTILDQCHRLDLGGLDHGELSNLKRHAVVGKKVYLIDYDTASVQRRVSNVTSAAQYLFIGGPIAKKVRGVLGIKSVEPVLKRLKDYKVEMEVKTYFALLKALRMS